MMARNEESTLMLASGSRVGDYELLRYVTSGGMSEVHEGCHIDTGISVAVKILHRDLCLDGNVIKRFFNEAQVLEALAHKRIVAVLACGLVPEGPPFMVLEWLPFSLDQALEGAGKALASPVAARVAAQIAEAAAALHERGVIHRDLKPANILMAEADPARAELKLADFGLIKVLGSKATGALSPIDVFAISTANSDLLGTSEYTAPEQWIQSKNVDAKADVYSLGVLLFQMLTGTLPFLASQPKEWMALHTLRTPPLERLAGHAPSELRDLVARMLGKKAGPRPTMREVESALALLQ